MLTTDHWRTESHGAEHPTAKWTAQQIIEIFPDNEAPRYLLRDRDGIYSEYFRSPD